MEMRIGAVKRLRGEVTVPGDKSISHRGVMFGAISEGTTELTGFLPGADCVSTINCFRKMGIEIDQYNEHVIIRGKGLHGLNPSSEVLGDALLLDAGNSGTTTRLISGILSGQSFSTIIDGDASLRTRPMKRIMEPLLKMGADVSSIIDEYTLGKLGVEPYSKKDGCLPLMIRPATGGLHGINYNSPVASAQVKSCILLAGLYADSPTTVTEPALSRDHTERMLRGFGADIESRVNFVPDPSTENPDISDLSNITGKSSFSATIKPEPKLMGQSIAIPGDISSAAYFIAAGLIHPDAEILIKNVGINPTRAGIIKVATEMGGNIKIENRRTVSGEDVADLLVRSSELHGTTIEGDIIPTLIDELPMIAVIAACSSGETVIRDAAELRVKESDRIATVTENLTAMGVDITPTEDGMIIHGFSNKKGSSPLYGAPIKTYLDHRIAMSFAVASLVAEGETTLDHPECVDISYPEFYTTLDSIKD